MPLRGRLEINLLQAGFRLRLQHWLRACHRAAPCVGHRAFARCQQAGGRILRLSGAAIVMAGGAILSGFLTQAFIFVLPIQQAGCLSNIYQRE